jgi:nicotinate (nicotinamide) nucleotide adenylyltransferase
MVADPNIIYFGGAFDPVHKGHMDSVQIVREFFPNAKITVVPGFLPPRNANEQKSIATAFVDRVAMVVVAFDEWAQVDVSSVEEELKTPNYTYLTLEKFSQENPGSRLAWMIGADQLQSFPTWRNPRRILELASLVVLPRLSLAGGDLLEMATHVASSLGFSTTVDKDNFRVDLDGGGSIYVMKRMPQSVSSSEIRKLATKNLKEIETMVAPAVMDYISDLGLYQN